MRPSPRPLLVLGFVLVMALLMAVYAPPSPTLSRALKDVETRLGDHYRRTPPPAGWTLIGVAALSNRSEIWVDFAVAATHPAVMEGKPYRSLAKIMAGLCPPRADPAWRLLAAGQEIELRAASGDRGVLLAVNCRAQGEVTGK